MGIHEDRQIHTKTGFRPIKLQGRLSGAHTNRTPCNNSDYRVTRSVLEIRSSTPFVWPELARTVRKSEGS